MAGDLPEAWVAPPEVRDLERARPLQGQAGSPADIGQGPGACGDGQVRDPAGTGRHVRPGGQVLLDKMPLPQPYRYRVDSLRRLIEVFDDEIDIAESQVHKRLGPPGLQRRPGPKRGGPGDRGHFRGRDRRYQALQQRPPAVQLGRPHPLPQGIRRQGPPGPHNQTRLDLVRSPPGKRCPLHGGRPHTRVYADRQRRGTPDRSGGGGRKLITLVFYGLREGEVRCLKRQAA